MLGIKIGVNAFKADTLSIVLLLCPYLKVFIEVLNGGL